MTLRNFIKRCPLASFFGITFFFTWSLIAVIIVSMRHGQDPTQMPPQFLLLALVAGMGPSLAGIAVTSVTGEKGSSRALLARLGHWRVNAGWYAAALLVSPLVAVAALTLLSVLGRPASLGDMASRLAIRPDLAGLRRLG